VLYTVHFTAFCLGGRFFADTVFILLLCMSAVHKNRCFAGKLAHAPAPAIYRLVRWTVGQLGPHVLFETWSSRSTPSTITANQLQMIKNHSKINCKQSG